MQSCWQEPMWICTEPQEHLQKISLRYISRKILHSILPNSVLEHLMSFFVFVSNLDKMNLYLGHITIMDPENENGHELLMSFLLIRAGRWPSE